jgi:hypothetical protein
LTPLFLGVHGVLKVAALLLAVIAVVGVARDVSVAVLAREDIPIQVASVARRTDDIAADYLSLG